MPEGAIYESYKQVRTITAAVDLVSIKVLDQNKCRKGMVIFNDSPGSVWISYGSTAAFTSATAVIGPYARWDMPGPAIWLGEISGIREAETGPLVITELI